MSCAAVLRPLPSCKAQPGFIFRPLFVQLEAEQDEEEEEIHLPLHYLVDCVLIFGLFRSFFNAAGGGAGGGGGGGAFSSLLPSLSVCPTDH